MALKKYIAPPSTLLSQGGFRAFHAVPRRYVPRKAYRSRSPPVSIETSHSGERGTSVIL